MKTLKQKLQSDRMRIRNANDAKLNGNARAMYLSQAVHLENATEVAKKSNEGKGWV